MSTSGSIAFLADKPSGRRTGLGQRLARIGIAYVAVVIALLIMGWLAPSDGGPLVIAEILVAHFAIAALLLAPVAALARSRSLAIALTVLVVLFGARFGSEWWSPTILDVNESTIDVAAWNVEAGAAAGPSVVALLTSIHADIVSIEELTPDVAAAIEADPALGDRFGFRALFPSDGVAGIGILSRYPILSVSNALHPVRLEIELQVEGGNIFVLAAHPFPAEITRIAGLPAGFDPSGRNRDLDGLRQRVLELDVLHDNVLLLGDFNTAPTEPAFGRLVNGLHDAHAEAGVGPGWTWRPARFAFLGIGLLRIDLILSSSALEPVSSSVVCPAIGDHCLVQATLRLGV